jgi:hypothetical protein
LTTSLWSLTPDDIEFAPPDFSADERNDGTEDGDRLAGDGYENFICVGPNPTSLKSGRLKVLEDDWRCGLEGIN